MHVSGNVYTHIYTYEYVHVHIRISSFAYIVGHLFLSSAVGTLYGAIGIHVGILLVHRKNLVLIKVAMHMCRVSGVGMHRVLGGAIKILHDNSLIMLKDQGTSYYNWLMMMATQVHSTCVNCSFIFPFLQVSRKCF